MNNEGSEEEEALDDMTMINMKKRNSGRECVLRMCQVPFAYLIYLLTVSKSKVRLVKATGHGWQLA